LTDCCKTQALNRAKGGAGEGVAGMYLVKHGFELVQNNYRNKHGEIDIIAIKYAKIGGTTEPVYHFVEVKFRLSNTYGMGREAVNKSKQKRIRSAAQYYLIENGLHDRVYSCFDVIEITGTLDNPNIEFLENCF
jgi:putative endonuclease